MLTKKLFLLFEDALSHLGQSIRIRLALINYGDNIEAKSMTPYKLYHYVSNLSITEAEDIDLLKYFLSKSQHLPVLEKLVVDCSALRTRDITPG